MNDVLAREHYRGQHDVWFREACQCCRIDRMAAAEKTAAPRMELAKVLEQVQEILYQIGEAAEKENEWLWEVRQAADDLIRRHLNGEPFDAEVFEAVKWVARYGIEAPESENFNNTVAKPLAEVSLALDQALEELRR